MAPPSRRYSEKEVADIIKRASELQQLESTAESTTGMSLTELEQVAARRGSTRRSCAARRRISTRA
jgi:hypothetical protein